jgi:hypothetical protein
MRAGAAVFGVAAIVMSFVVPGDADAQGVEVIEVLYDSVIESPCNGEPIHFVGAVEVRVNTVVTPGGITRTSSAISYHDLEAIGLVSGTVYNVTGAYHDSYGQLGDAANETYVNRFDFIAPGAGGNVFYQELLHVTVNANGETTVVQDPFVLECR